MKCFPPRDSCHHLMLSFNDCESTSFCFWFTRKLISTENNWFSFWKLLLIFLFQDSDGTGPYCSRCSSLHAKTISFSFAKDDNLFLLFIGIFSSSFYCEIISKDIILKIEWKFRIIQFIFYFFDMEMRFLNFQLFIL